MLRYPRSTGRFSTEDPHATPVDALKGEYSRLLSVMQVREECQKLVDEVAVKLIGYKTRYQPVTDAIGVPILFIGPSFEREGSSNFSLNPAQGWPLHSTSKIIPHNGPFPNWFSAAIAAYKIDGLDKVGAANWTWEMLCFSGEKLNGFGYRDEHHMHSLTCGAAPISRCAVSTPVTISSIRTRSSSARHHPGRKRSSRF